MSHQTDREAEARELKARRSAAWNRCAAACRAYLETPNTPTVREVRAAFADAAQIGNQLRLLEGKSR